VGHIEPEPERIRDFLSQGDPDAPIVMINLLRYRDRAVYPDGAGADGAGAEPCSGREAYQRYGAEAARHVAEAGGRILWMGAVGSTVIGPADEAWDDAVLVEYPSRKAFLAMVSKPEYQASAVHRSAALEDSRLICTEPRASLLGSVGG
jgi:uncharacterized protein (DUF1330 family)